MLWCSIGDILRGRWKCSFISVIFKEYDISRSFRRGVTTQSRNKKASSSDIDDTNRWMNTANAQGHKIPRQMRDCYTVISQMLRALLRFSVALSMSWNSADWFQQFVMIKGYKKTGGVLSYIHWSYKDTRSKSIHKIVIRSFLILRERICPPPNIFMSKVSLGVIWANIMWQLMLLPIFYVLSTYFSSSTARAIASPLEKLYTWGVGSCHVPKSYFLCSRNSQLYRFQNKKIDQDI